MKRILLSTLFKLNFYFNYDLDYILKESKVIKNYIFEEKFKKAFLEVDVIMYRCKIPNCIIKNEVYVRAEYIKEIIYNKLKSEYIIENGYDTNLAKIRKFQNDKFDNVERTVMFEEIDKDILQSIINKY